VGGNACVCVGEGVGVDIGGWVKDGYNTHTQIENKRLKFYFILLSNKMTHKNSSQGNR
jgi:hypothetical protein